MEQETTKDLWKVVKRKDGVVWDFKTGAKHRDRAFFISPPQHRKATQTWHFSVPNLTVDGKVYVWLINCITVLVALHHLVAKTQGQFSEERKVWRISYKMFVSVSRKPASNTTSTCIPLLTILSRGSKPTAKAAGARGRPVPKKTNSMKTTYHCGAIALNQ